jgi:tyrosine-protein kinase Etk/Wzc
MANPSQRNDQERLNRLGVVGPAPAMPPSIDLEGHDDDGVDLAQLWGTIRDNIRFVVGIGAVVFCGVMFATMMSRMTFRSSGRLYLGELESRARPSSSGSGEMDFSGGGQGDVSSEIEILKSQSLVTQAILSSGLNVDIRPAGWKQPRLWQWLVAGRNPNVLDVPAQELGAVNTAISENSLGMQRFRVVFSSPTDYTISADGRELGKSRLGQALRVEGLTITLVEGSERGPDTGSTYDLAVHPLDAVTDGVLSTLAVAAPKPIGGEAAKVVTLEFMHNSPYSSASFLRKLMLGYLGERQAWKTEDASAAEMFVTDQLRSLRESLDRTQKNLADYRSTHRVVVLDNEARAMIEQIAKYEEQRVAARLEVAHLSDMRRVLKSPNPAPEAFMFGEASDSVLKDLSNGLSESRNALVESEVQFGPNAQQTQKQRSQVEAQLDQIRNYVNSRSQRAQEGLGSLSAIISQFEEKLKTVPGAELGLAQLGRESEVYSRVYSYMLERQQQAAITKASTVSKNRILDFPQVPYREDSPKLGLRLASGPLALLFGCIMVLLSRFLSVAFQSDAEIRRSVGGLPLLGTLPRRVRPRKTDADDGELVEFAQAARDPTAYSEALRTLRTNLMLSNVSDRGRVVAFTSPVPGDGKTTTVMSLAAGLALDGKRVLLVDADMRKPSHHKIIGYAYELGLRSVLSTQVAWRDVLHRFPFGSGVLDCLGAGKMAPAELLSGERMHRFLNEARDHYDYILLDSPSFPLVSDSLVLANVSDCVVSVFRMRHTPRKIAVEHVRRLAPSALSYALVINDSNSLGQVYGEEPRSKLLERVLGFFTRVSQSALFSKSLSTWSALCAVIIAGAGITILVRDPAHQAHRARTPYVAPPAASQQPSAVQSQPAPSAPEPMRAPAATQPPGLEQPGALPAPLPKWWELEKAGRLIAPAADQQGPATGDVPATAPLAKSRRSTAVPASKPRGWILPGSEAEETPASSVKVPAPLPDNPYK